jgi:hypothetical protein
MTANKSVGLWVAHRKIKTLNKKEFKKLWFSELKKKGKKKKKKKPRRKENRPVPQKTYPIQ